MIDLVQSFSHLGHLITSDSDDVEDSTIRKPSLIGQVNNTLCYFGKLSSFIKYNLIYAYCTSYYGCQLWSLSNSNVKEFVLLGGRACDACRVFRFRLTVFCYHFCVNAFPSKTKYVGVLLILFGHVSEMYPITPLVQFIALYGLVVVHFLVEMWYFVLSSLTVPLTI